MVEDARNDEAVTARHGGIGGWLLALCIVQAIIHPLFLGVLALALLDLMLASPELFFSLVNIFAVAGLGSLAVGSLVSGVFLWRKAPFGITLTQIFLTANAAFSTAMLLIARDKDVWLWFDIGYVLYALLGLTYLAQSKRVTQTYFKEETDVR